ncbi:histone H1 [Pedobacter gandavensis]|uniref:histone H1 n=1 Tax=Pedobacter gandavensis TaxID=2679963 RepID=UPI00247920B8|nr:histone H1 [Pedobacter gandavensis]WGQ09917.1 histone H1 [Pedobacter gandavensis]
MEKFNQIKTLISQIEVDADKFYNRGNSAAGTRLRKGMLALKALANQQRKEVTAIKYNK